MQISDGLGLHEHLGPQLQTKLRVLPWTAKQNTYRQLAQIKFKKKSATFITLWPHDASFTDDTKPDLKEETQQGLFQHARST
jgi:hypothetical protein